MNKLQKKIEKWKNLRNLYSVDTPHEKNSYKRKPSWVREDIQGAERYVAPEEMHREMTRTRSYSSYVALLCDIIDKEPSNMKKWQKRKNGRMR